MSSTSLPGGCAKHAVVTPECIASKGADCASREAVERLLAEFDSCEPGWREDGVRANFHFALTVERIRG